MMIDTAVEETLLDYLIAKNVFKKNEYPKVYYFSGGVSCVVAFVSGGDKLVIVKQALPKLKVAELWECDPRRIVVEHKALEVYANIVPEYVPAPMFYDEDNLIMCREAVPEDCAMWKTHLLAGMLDFRAARKAMEILSRVHNRTAGDKKLAETFRETGVFYNLRINPYIEFTVSKYPELKEKSVSVISLLMDEKAALVHGDYSPKNILVKDDRIFVLDMEVAHFGNPAFDTAFFANHFLLKAVKNKDWSDAYFAMLRYMMSIYFNQVGFSDPGNLEKTTVLLLGFLFLARVDGKSPAEYITEEPDKELIRRAAIQIIQGNITDFDEVIRLVKKELIHETL